MRIRVRSWFQVRALVAELVKKITQQRVIFCYKLPTVTVWETVTSGLEDLACYFVTERKQNGDKVYCSCNERDPWPGPEKVVSKAC